MMHGIIYNSLHHDKRVHVLVFLGELVVVFKDGPVAPGQNRNIPGFCAFSPAASKSRNPDLKLAKEFNHKGNNK